jgi:hypothetical protein
MVEQTQAQRSAASNQAAIERQAGIQSAAAPVASTQKQVSAAERQAEVERAAGLNTVTVADNQALAAKNAGEQARPAPTVITSSAATARNETNQAELAATQDNLVANAPTSPPPATPPAPTPPPAVPTPTTSQTGTNTPSQPTVDPLQGQIDSATSAIDAEYDQTVGLLDARMASLNSATAAQVASIKASYAVRREETKRLNQVLLQSNTKAGIRAGRDRYASEINQGILTDVEQQGLRRISELDAEELELINAAQAANDTNQFNLLASKMQQIHEKRKEKEAVISKLHADAMAAEQAAFERAKDLREMQKWDREDASASVDAMVASGMDPASVPPEYFAQLDAKANFVPGTSAGMMRVAQQERNAASEADFISNMNSVMELTTKLRPDQYVEFNGNKYYGDKSDNEFIGYEIEEATGNIVSISRNLITGEVSSSTQFGVLEPNIKYNQEWIDNGDGTESLWYVPTDPNFKPVPVNPHVGTSSGGIDSGAVQEAFPNGMTLANGGEEQGMTYKDFWCLRWAGNLDVRGDALINEIGDTIQSKRASVETDIGWGAGARRPPQAGDYILTNESPDWGHIAYISEIRTDPNTGKKVAVLSESNYTAGTVTHTRTMELSEANMEANGGKILGFKHSELKPEYSSQPEQGGPSFTRLTEEAREETATPFEPSTPQESSILNAFNVISGRLGSKDIREGAQNTLNTYLANGDIESAQSYLKDLAYTGANAATQKQVDGRTNAINELQTVQTLLDEYAASGGNTGLFTGTQAQIEKKLGKLKDPVLQDIATRINLSLIDYRAAVSGAAFTESEAQFYSDLFPSILSGTELNKSTINSLVNVFSDRQDAFYRTQLGSKNYDELFGESASPEQALLSRYPEQAAKIREALNATNPDGSAKYTLKQIEEALQ